MKKYICNPVNLNYRYQFHIDPKTRECEAVCREAADPSVILFQGSYYLFASMTLGVWVSQDLVSWEYHRLPDTLPLYDYAPDVRVCGEYVYFSASRRGRICNFYRTKDILKGPYEEIEGTFEFWDPNLFLDEDGRMYFYWGCDNAAPIYGVELAPDTMKPLTERVELIFGEPERKGYERIGENGMVPYIEGAWMEKYQGRYYLQYAFGGTEFHTYGDGVYVSNHPLGPFHLAKNNPYSYHPGGFFPGAGHGSTFRDLSGNWWHAATMRISVSHPFERCVGIWPAGFDEEGELYCNQRYGDWPMEVTGLRDDPWREPEWFLLSYGKKAEASTSQPGHEPGRVCDENVQTWWRAAAAQPGQWVTLDLGREFDVRAIQVHFADDFSEGLPKASGKIHDEIVRPRNIDEQKRVTRWRLKGSLDGETYFTIEDRSQADTDLAHDLVVHQEGLQIRYLKLVVLEMPFGQPAAVSGLRVFGIGSGSKPGKPVFEVERSGELDLLVTIRKGDAMGYQVLWGTAPDKLYHSYLIFDRSVRIAGTVKGQDYCVRVDAFHEAGITKGECVWI